jgi:hypothetical protein
MAGFEYARIFHYFIIIRFTVDHQAVASGVPFWQHRSKNKHYS